MPIFHILEKTTDDRRGNHVADVLRHIAAVALKGDADHLAILQHGPPLLPGLMAASIWMVRCESTPECEYVWKSMRDTTPRRDREPITADRIAVHGYRAFDAGNAAEIQRARYS